jgi:cortactin
VDKSAVGWEHHEELNKHESQKVDKTCDKTPQSYDDQPDQKIGTNYQKTKPDIAVKNSGNLRARFENMAKETEAEAKRKAEDEKKRREEREKREHDDSKKKEEKRKAEENMINEAKEEVERQHKDQQNNVGFKYFHFLN